MVRIMNGKIIPDSDLELGSGRASSSSAGGSVSEPAGASNVVLQFFQRPLTAIGPDVKVWHVLSLVAVLFFFIGPAALAIVAVLLGLAYLSRRHSEPDRRSSSASSSSGNGPKSPGSQLARGSSLLSSTSSSSSAGMPPGTAPRIYGVSDLPRQARS